MDNSVWPEIEPYNPHKMIQKHFSQYAIIVFTKTTSRSFFTNFLELAWLKMAIKIKSGSTFDQIGNEKPDRSLLRGKYYNKLSSLKLRQD